MRPQYNRRARRASAALGAAALAVALAGPAGAATLPASPAALGGDGAHRALSAHAAAAAQGARALHSLGRARAATPAGLFTAPLTFVRHGTRAIAVAAARRLPVAHSFRHATRRVHLRAVMLHPQVLVGQDVTFVGATRPGRARRL